MIGNKWDFCLMTYKIHSCVFQSQFRSSFCLARNWLGVDPSVTLVCSKWDLLDMWLLLMGMASPWLDREMHPRFTSYSWLCIFRPSRESCQSTTPSNSLGKVCISLVWLSGYNICSLSGHYRCYAMSWCSDSLYSTGFTRFSKSYFSP